MVDLQESPAVPPERVGGDERLGLFAAGGILIALGWGLGVVLNLVAHRLASAHGTVWGWIRIYPSLGPFAWATLALGLFAGAMGVGFLLLARGSPRGPLVLPGQPY